MSMWVVPVGCPYGLFLWVQYGCSYWLLKWIVRMGCSYGLSTWVVLMGCPMTAMVKTVYCHIGVYMPLDVRLRKQTPLYNYLPRQNRWRIVERLVCWTGGREIVGSNPRQ